MGTRSSRRSPASGDGQIQRIGTRFACVSAALRPDTTAEVHVSGSDGDVLAIEVPAAAEVAIVHEAEVQPDVTYARV